jgi:hypothetical protein
MRRTLACIAAILAVEAAAVPGSSATGHSTPRPFHRLEIARWSGENNLTDSVGNDDGQSVGKMAFTRGVVGRAMRFSGHNYVKVPDEPELDLYGSYTIALWARWGATQDFEGLISKRRGSARPGQSFANYGFNVFPGVFGVGFYYDDPKVSDVGDDGNDFEVARLARSPQDGRWHHVAASVQQRGKNAYINLYLDGKHQVTRTFPGQLRRSVNDQPLVFGASNPQGGEALRGALDEITIYRQSLNARQIRILYESMHH